MSHGKVVVGNKIKLAGTMRPFAAREKVTLIMFRGKKTIKRKKLHAKRKPGHNYSHFKFAKKLVKPGRYSVQVIHHPSPALKKAKDRTRNFKIRYPDVDPGNRSTLVQASSTTCSPGRATSTTRARSTTPPPVAPCSPSTR